MAQAEEARRMPWWRRRLADGFVRECHGDLHLGNLVQLPEGPTAFDCIEFDPALRWIDTMNDLAFLTMDLQVRGRRDLAFALLDGYLSHSGDWDGLAGLRYFEVYRALVRAMVAGLRQGQGGAPADEPDYLGWALRHATPPAGAAPLLITHGLSGSGKSTWARALLQAAGAVRLRSDVERKRLFGLGPLDDSRAHGLDIYTPEATERTFAQLEDTARTLLQAGYPVIVDAAFLRRDQRDRRAGPGTWAAPGSSCTARPGRMSWRGGWPSAGHRAGSLGGHRGGAAAAAGPCPGTGCRRNRAAVTVGDCTPPAWLRCCSAGWNRAEPARERGSARRFAVAHQQHRHRGVTHHQLGIAAQGQAAQAAAAVGAHDDQVAAGLPASATTTSATRPPMTSRSTTSDATPAACAAAWALASTSLP
jgi:hypothetical protein